MSYRPGDTFYLQFITNNISGAVVSADALPTGVLNRNGFDDFSSKSYVYNIDLGRYGISGLIPPTYNKGDTIGFSVSGYVNGILGKQWLGLGALDSLYIGDLTGSAGFATAVATGLSNCPIENGVNFKQLASALGAVLAGSSTVNYSTNTISYYAMNNNGITRVQSTAVSGARNVVVLFLPS